MQKVAPNDTHVIPKVNALPEEWCIDFGDFPKIREPRTSKTLCLSPLVHRFYRFVVPGASIFRFADARCIDLGCVGLSGTLGHRYCCC